MYQPEKSTPSYVREQVYAEMAKREYIWGTYVWNMFDFGSGIRHEGDIGATNTKGLVTFTTARPRRIRSTSTRPSGARTRLPISPAVVTSIATTRRQA